MINQNSFIHATARRVLTMLSIALLTLALLPSSAFARDYGISQVDIDATVGTDGSLSVREVREFDFDGSFHGVYWKIPTGYYQGRAIDTSVVSVGEIINGSYVEFEQSTSGAEHTYELSEYSSYVQVKLYSSHEDERAQFVINYVDNDLATRYDDTSELYWKFVSDGWDVESHNVTCTVHLPVPSGQEVLGGDNVRAWGHGPLDASVSFDNGDVLYVVPGVGSSEFAEARIAFPAEWLSETDSVGYDALSSILSEEQGWADQANARRARARIMVGGTQLIAAVVPIASLVMCFVLRQRYKLKHRPQFDDKYFRDVPSDDHPAVLGALLENGEATDECLTAALMRLTDQGFTKLELIRFREKGLFGREKEKQDYCLTPVRWPSDSGVGNSERIDYDTMKFLFQRLAPLSAHHSDNHDVLYFDSIEKIARSHPERYDSYLKSWKGAIRTECDHRGFFHEEGGTGMALLIIMGVLDILIASAALVLMIAFGGPILPTIFLPMLGIFSGVGLILISAFTFKKLSPEAVELKAKLEALKRWLKDFTRLEEAVPQDVILWNRLLVMAVVLGVSDEVIKQLKMAAPQILQDTRMASTYGWFYSSGPSMPSRSFTQAMSSAHSVSAAKLASSSSSSGGGGGGGFSGGGGGGFGGGGGGGAF